MAMSSFGDEKAAEKHKFDKDYDQKLTHAQFWMVRYGEFMQLAAALKKEWGQERLVEFLKKATAERMLKFGQGQARQAGKSDFQSYVGMFRGPQYKDFLTLEIVEDADTVFEMKVTECIWAKTFVDVGLGEIGYAHICFGDYSWASGFNPKIKMVRDKTLMQGHECCNHRYIWEG